MLSGVASPASKTFEPTTHQTITARQHIEITARFMFSTKNKIRIATALSYAVHVARRIGGAQSDVVEVKRGGLRWRLDLNEGIDFSIYLLGAFERSTVLTYRRLIPPAAVVLDIGANVGAHTLHMARAVGATGRVYAFEPTVYAFHKLKRNLALNPDIASRVTAEQIMLTDRPDVEIKAEVYSSWPLSSDDQLHAKHLGRPESITGSRAERLDDYLIKTGIQRLDFIKLDVDGFECHVLGGSLATLQKFRPIILMELSPYVLTERGRSSTELLSIMKQSGYSFYHLDGKTALPDDSVRLQEMVPDGSSLNVIARMV
jgi:FkbM family methyltransferase